MFGARCILERMVLAVDFYATVGDVVQSLSERIEERAGSDLGSSSLANLQCRLVAYSDVAEHPLTAVGAQLTDLVGEVPHSFCGGV